MRYEGYDTAQVCKNGHVINSMAVSHPESNQKFCDSCGEGTVTSCSACNSPIRGYHHVPGVVSFLAYHPPKYCYNCGNAYPWTETKLQITKELIELEIKNEDVAEFMNCISDLVRNTPNVSIAKIRVKKTISLIDQSISKEIHDNLSDLINLSIREEIWGKVKGKK